MKEKGPIWIFNYCVFIRKKGLIKFRIIEQRIKSYICGHPSKCES